MSRLAADAAHPYGALVPLMPRFFSDTALVCSTRFGLRLNAAALVRTSFFTPAGARVIGSLIILLMFAAVLAAFTSRTGRTIP